MLNLDHAAIRTSYRQAHLHEDAVLNNPINQFSKWYDEAIEAAISEVNAMTLATADRDGQPDARIVLLKSFSEQGFLFFTNYQSAKGRQLAQNPKASLVFFWKELERQVRIKGTVLKVDEQSSEDYFYSRPIESQKGAICSNQSQVIKDRKTLDEQFELVSKLPITDIKRPEHWGGYVLKAIEVEFWQGRESRLHDRINYCLDLKHNWIITRLQP